MSERRKETNDPTPQPLVEDREEASGSYYYDDGTGYEVYVPEHDEEASDPAGDGDRESNAEPKR